ncbi:hypothetical protein A9P82_13095 [Arachidicoccus ginsenosidimutans]|uniref:hypothetical protein n=1 Tax=Arachidicoccus sp. BS20 TaxID=1850526 RepID=UPI0007F0D728|nr:hypothetical protein [Arachidicoccus sp. BS20]ANI90138.1 hypothetical protein A9P82_13095 [Arachidicoccus sp. BS20]
MEEQKEDFFKDYGNKITEYIDDRLLLLRLKSVKKISQVMGQLMCIAIIMGLCLLIFLFLSVMLGFLLGRLFDSEFAGFGTVTGLFIIALVIMIVKRKQIQSKFFGNLIIDILLDKNEDEDEVA